MDIYQGAADTQTPDQKALNYSQAEFVAGQVPAIWTEKPRTSWRQFSQREQDGSSMCVCMTEATERGILALQKYNVWIDFSSTFLYQQRKYPTLPGCTSEDIYSIFPKLGDVFEKDMPSQSMDDTAAMLVPKQPYFADLAQVFKAVRIQLPLDFETVASTVQQTNKGVMCWFHFSMPEWTATPQVVQSPTTSGHSVTVTDFTTVNGKKFLVVQDSFDLSRSDNGVRLISEEYFAARCFLASYLMNFQLQAGSVTTVSTRPSFDGSIVSAQKCFKWEGLFPLNIQEVENWGNITRAACIKFQIKYGIVPALGNFGPITQAKLYQLYP